MLTMQTIKQNTKTKHRSCQPHLQQGGIMWCFDYLSVPYINTHQHPVANHFLVAANKYTIVRVRSVWAADLRQFYTMTPSNFQWQRAFHFAAIWAILSLYRDGEYSTTLSERLLRLTVISHVSHLTPNNFISSTIYDVPLNDFNCFAVCVLFYNILQALLSSQAASLVHTISPQ